MRRRRKKTLRLREPGLAGEFSSENAFPLTASSPRSADGLGWLVGEGLHWARLATQPRTPFKSEIMGLTLGRLQRPPACLLPNFAVEGGVPWIAMRSLCLSSLERCPDSLTADSFAAICLELQELAVDDRPRHRPSGEASHCGHVGTTLATAGGRAAAAPRAWPRPALRFASPRGPALLPGLPPDLHPPLWAPETATARGTRLCPPRLRLVPT